MRNFVFKFGDLVPDNRPRDSIQLVIHKIHGDADITEEETITLPFNATNLAEIITKYTFGKILIDHQYERCGGDCPLWKVDPSKEDVKEFLINELGDITDLGVDLAIKFMLNEIGHDRIWEGTGTLAGVDRMEIFHYNPEGEKFACSYEEVK